MSEFNDSLRLTPKDMETLQPEKLPKPISKEELISAQNEHSWRTVEPNKEQIAAETDAAWREDQKKLLEAKLVEAHILLHAEKQNGHEAVMNSAVDHLTGLANKMAFDEWLEYKLAEKSNNLTVAFMDIDRFKEINDSYGHAVGDEVLKYLAKLLTHAIREDQDIAARRSGDEFIIGIDGADEKRVRDIADAILETVNAIGVAQDGRLVPAFGTTRGVQKIQLSIGFVRAQPGMTSVQLQDRADKIMYQAKESGRNQYILDGFSQSEQVDDSTN